MKNGGDNFSTFADLIYLSFIKNAGNFSSYYYL